MTLGDIELAVYDQLGFNSTPDSGVARRFRQYINAAQREILGMRGMGQMRRRVLPAVSVANSVYMPLPQAAVAVIGVTDRTNNRNLDPISLPDTRFRDPGRLFSGSIPDAYSVANWSSPVALDPSTADSLYVVSTAAGDGSGIATYVQGILSDGTFASASITLNGLTAVNISSTISTWVSITRFYLSGLASGTVTLLQTSGVGQELARITAGHSSAKYTILELSGVPSTATTYYCDVEVHIEDMVNPYDEPLIHEDYHDLLVCGALKKEFLRRKAMDQFSVENAYWKAGVINMGASLRRRGGVSRGGQRGELRQGTSYSNPWIPAN